MHHAIQIYAIINLAVIGVSHVVRPRVWVDFFILLRERGEAGVVAVAILNLIFGSIIVAFHNVWSGIPLVLTVWGWLNVIKALLQSHVPRDRPAPTLRTPPRKARRDRRRRDDATGGGGCDGVACVEGSFVGRGLRPGGRMAEGGWVRGIE